MSVEKGKKITEGKRKWHAMPLIMLEPLADVFQAGVGHYGRFNVLKPFDNPDHDFYDSTMRHLAACQIDPLAIDPQDGCRHLAKVAFGALARLYHCSRVDVVEKRKTFNGRFDAVWSDTICPKCENGGAVARDGFGEFCVMSGCGWEKDKGE